MMKFCRKCRVDTKRYANGHCAPCGGARVAAWVKANRDKRRAGYAAWRARNLEKSRADAHNRKGYPVPTRPRPDACEICGSEPSGRVTVLCLEHCHETGIFRGWVCERCNKGLAIFGDNLDAIIERLTRYRDMVEAERWLAIPGSGLPI